MWWILWWSLHYLFTAESDDRIISKICQHTAQLWAREGCLVLTHGVYKLCAWRSLFCLFNSAQVLQMYPTTSVVLVRQTNRDDGKQAAGRLEAAATPLLESWKLSVTVVDNCFSLTCYYCVLSASVSCLSNSQPVDCSSSHVYKQHRSGHAYP